MHVGLHGFEFDAGPEHVAERAVRVREAEVQISVLVVRRAGNHLACAREYVHLQHRFVGHAVAKRRAFYAEPRHGPSEGDGLELRDDEWHHRVAEECIDQFFVRRHPSDVRVVRPHVDADHP